MELSGQKWKPEQRVLTRNLRFCFHCAPWALVCRWASVTSRIRSHSATVGSGRVCRDFTISSFLRFSLFSSIRRRLATRFESSRTTGEEKRKDLGLVTLRLKVVFYYKTHFNHNNLWVRSLIISNPNFNINFLNAYQHLHSLNMFKFCQQTHVSWDFIKAFV